jgi:hypothetical protein
MCPWASAGVMGLHHPFLRAGLLLLLGGLVSAQVCSGATGHSQCPVGFYCDAGQTCYTCTFISPDNCDALAIAGDCCSDEFLMQCVANPAACPPPPPPPPSSGSGWTIVILVTVAAGMYVGGGIGFTRFYKKEDNGEPILTAHPHYHMWQQVPPLLNDGYRYFRSRIGKPLHGDSDDYEAVAKLIKTQRRAEAVEFGAGGGSNGGYDEIDELSSDEGRAPSPAKAKKKKAKTPKPKPSAEGALLEEDGDPVE